MSAPSSSSRVALPPMHFVNKALAQVPCPRAKRLALYFSASWCGPCRQFTPKLAQLYQSTSREDIEVVFVSLDQTLEWFQDYYAGMPWLAVDFDKTEREEIFHKLGGRGIPALVVFCPRTGRVVTTDGRQDVLRHPDNPQACVDLWCAEPAAAQTDLA